MNQVITHKLGFKFEEHEIEIVGTKDFCETWFIKLHRLLINSEQTTRSPHANHGTDANHGTPTPTAPQLPATGTPEKFVDCIILAAYDLQEIHGKPFLLSGDIRAQMLGTGMKVPGSAGGFSMAIIQNLNKGFLERTGEMVGRQKAVRVTGKGKRYVEGGFRKLH